MKSAKIEDLRFEPNQAFEQFRQLAREVLSVTKSKTDQKSPKRRKRQRRNASI